MVPGGHLLPLARPQASRIRRSRVPAVEHLARPAAVAVDGDALAAQLVRQQVDRARRLRGSASLRQVDGLVRPRCRCTPGRPPASARATRARPRGRSRRPAHSSSGTSSSSRTQPLLGDLAPSAPSSSRARIRARPARSRGAPRAASPRPARGARRPPRTAARCRSSSPAMMLMVPVGAMVVVVALRSGGAPCRGVDAPLEVRERPALGRERLATPPAPLATMKHITSLGQRQRLLRVVRDAQLDAACRRSPSRPGRSCGCPASSRSISSADTRFTSITLSRKCTAARTRHSRPVPVDAAARRSIVATSSPG